LVRPPSSARCSLDADKTYEAVLRLGQRTTTADAEGELIAERPVAYTAERLSEVCGSSRV
jgi:tRNA pseudouridine55 synthase